MNTPAKLAYSIKEAAEAVGVSERTIRNAITDDHLIAFTPTGAGGKKLILADDLRAWVQRNGAAA